VSFGSDGKPLGSGGRVHWHWPPHWIPLPNSFCWIIWGGGWVHRWTPLWGSGSAPPWRVGFYHWYYESSLRFVRFVLWSCFLGKAQWQRCCVWPHVNNFTLFENATSGKCNFILGLAPTYRDPPWGLRRLPNPSVSFYYAPTRSRQLLVHLWSFYNHSGVSHSIPTTSMEVHKLAPSCTVLCVPPWHSAALTANWHHIWLDSKIILLIHRCYFQHRHKRFV
jgi:hypothetical protein